MEIEINGLKYRQKKQNNQQTAIKSKMAVMITGIAAKYGLNTYQRERPKVNIIDEFKLIQEKKSKLSRNDREWVISQFNRNFELVE